LLEARSEPVEPPDSANSKRRIGELTTQLQEAQAENQELRAMVGRLGIRFG
jgi:hypothetical protein